MGGWPPPESRPAARAPGPRGRGVGCVPQADIGAFGRLKEIISGVPKPVLYQSDIDLALTFHGSEPQLASVLLERALGLADDLASQKSKRCVVMYDRAGKGVYEFTETLFGRYVRELTSRDAVGRLRPAQTQAAGRARVSEGTGSRSVPRRSSDRAGGPH